MDTYIPLIVILAIVSYAAYLALTLDDNKNENI